MKKTTRYFIVKVTNHDSKEWTKHQLRRDTYGAGIKGVLDFNVCNIVKAVQYLQKKKDPAWKWVRAVFKECSG